MRFFKTKTPGIFRACDNSGKVRYLYGTIDSLVQAGVLVPDYGANQNGDRFQEYEKTHWVCIDRDGYSVEFDSKEELKEALRGI